MKKFKWIAFALVLVVLVVGAGILLTQVLTKPRAWPFTDAIRHADSMVVYEGLPHQMYEEKLLKQERSSKAVRELGGFPFYEEPLDISAADTKRLQRILADPETYSPFTVEKKCGGFHPDFAAEWTVGGEKYQALICFGCSEYILMGPGIKTRQEATGSTGLGKILGRYSVNRPPSEKGLFYWREVDE